VIPSYRQISTQSLMIKGGKFYIFSA